MNRRRLILVGLAVLGLVLAVRLLWPTPAGRPVPPLPDTPFANAPPGAATYVGTAACLECHRDQHESYLLTAHSQTLSEIDVDEEPPDGEVVHATSGRRYRIQRDGERLFHEAWATLSDGSEVSLGEYVARYAIGSGRFSRSYLVDAGEFLCESPLTWYGANRRWGMSPGYDRTGHLGFRRVIARQCLDCHAGRVESVDDSPFKLDVRELSVGCERCHGPGSLHVDLRERGAAPNHEEFDETIVNPVHLSRHLAESICQQCHLNSDVTVAARGRRLEDFRPGYPIESFRHEFAENDADEGMTVVGHVEQMQASPCYQGSETLTCTTCHDPHRQIPEPERVAHYRRICTDCHGGDNCSLPLPERESHPTGNDCTACHMPVSPTDIPHFAFRHHRIGLHDDGPADPVRNEDELLVPVTSVEGLDDAERRRVRGLAAFRLFVGGEEGSQKFSAYAMQDFVPVRDSDIEDPEVDAAIAVMAMIGRDWDLAVPMAESVLAANASPEARFDARFVLGRFHLLNERFAEATPHFEALVRDRREPFDAFLLGLCHESLRDYEAAARAFERALEIDPASGDVHQRLSRVYRRLDRGEDADRHTRLGRRLPSAGFEAGKMPPR